MSNSKNYRVCVIGAGVVGLSTAVCIQQSIPESIVTVFADKFGDETLSSGAGGLFRPEISIDFDTNKLRKWCRDSMDHFLEILKSPDASKAGMQCVSGYHLTSSEKHAAQNSFLKEMVPVYRDLSEKELKLFPSQYKNGIFFSTIITDCRYYLPWLTKKFKDAGGKIEIRHISKFSELPENYDVIVNCTGLGARNLLSDDMLIPVRGQTIKVKAPWIKHFYYGDEVYIVPGVDYITLGGVKDFGSWKMQVNPYQKQFIFDKCVELVPSLQNAEVFCDWVGLRPYRPSLRLDTSIIQCDGKYYAVVHNYGHGGHGVTLSWGTAKHATELVRKVLQSPELPISRL